jgi:superfamily II DNA or RNA helicase
VGAGRRRILLVAPTGSGKTVTAGATIAEAVRSGERVLFLAHRHELIMQASAKLHDFGIDHGVIKAGFPTRPGERVQVASVQTLHARAIRGTAMELPRADLVIVDEAHHCRAQTYRGIIESYPDAVILGMTATPCRGDGRGLGNVFEVIVECPPVAKLISNGYLVPARVYAPWQPDLKGVKVERGDYVENQLAQRMDKPQLVGDIVTNWHRLAERRPTVVFATGVSHSVHLRDEFCRSGVLAEHIDGSTPVEERDRILAGFAAGTIEVVCNAMVLTEGWDCPAVSCLVLARPTKSMGLYRQMGGRVLRPSPGKTDAIILDHAGAVFEHGFIDEPVIWTLDQDKRAENPTQSRRAERRMPTLTTCPECTAVRFEGDACSACGWRPRPKPVAVDVVDGELAEVNADGTVRAGAVTQAEKQLFYQESAYIAQEKGHKPGIAFFRFKEKFKGEMPPYRWRNLPPLPPRPETRAWYRSRQIAYSKAQQKASLERRSA